MGFRQSARLEVPKACKHYAALSEPMKENPLYFLYYDIYFLLHDAAFCLRNNERTSFDLYLIYAFDILLKKHCEKIVS